MATTEIGSIPSPRLDSYENITGEKGSVSLAKTGNYAKITVG
jgi:hypothetical protein